MNPTSNAESGMNLPPVAGEHPANPDMPETGLQPVESMPASPEMASTQGTVAPANSGQIPMPVIPQLPVNPIANVASSTTNTVVPDVTDDSDLIEKEWVNKAKKIVELTRDDPYAQSEELTVFKADYMKKRYDKTIKLK